MGLFNTIEFEEEFQFPDGIIVRSFQSKDFNDADCYKITANGQIIRTVIQSFGYYEDVYELLVDTFDLNITVYANPSLSSKLNSRDRFRKAIGINSDIHEYDLHFKNGILTQIFCYQTGKKVKLNRKFIFKKMISRILNLFKF